MGADLVWGWHVGYVYVIYYYYNLDSQSLIKMQSPITSLSPLQGHHLAILNNF